MSTQTFVTVLTSLNYKISCMFIVCGVLNVLFAHICSLTMTNVCLV